MTSSQASNKPNELIYQLRGLSLGGAILHVGAHPDDEDVGLMAYVARKYAARIVYWSATRGEGGQNRIGPDKQEALGVYRSWESLSARSLDGGEALYGPFYDFGFSKSGPETLTKWGGHEAVVREIVRAIRQVQPQVVIGRWTGDPSSGHGHHQAVGAATLDAFEAAGDPDRFAELEPQGLVAWQAQKLYFSTGGDWQPGEGDRAFGARQPDFERDGFVRVNTGELDPICNRTYQEQAWIGFNSHKTQAIGFVPDKGPFFYYYRLASSLVPVPQKEQALYDGLDKSLAGLADYPGQAQVSLRDKLETVQAGCKAALKAFRAEDPMLAVDPLLEALATLQETCARHAGGGDQTPGKKALAIYLARKAKAFEEVIAECLGLHLDCLSSRARIGPGEKFRVVAKLWNHRQTPLHGVEFSVCTPVGWKHQAADIDPSDEPLAGQLAAYTISVDREADLTCPYWLIQVRDPYRYKWPSTSHAGQAFDPPLVELECRLTLSGQQLTLRRPAILREAFPGGYRELPLAVVPPISLHPKRDKEYFPTRQTQQQLELQVVTRSNVESQRLHGELKLEVPPGWMVEPARIPLTMGKRGDSRTVSFVVTIPAGVPEGNYPLRHVVECEGREYGVVLHAVRMAAPGLPRLPDEATCIKEQLVSYPAVGNIHLIDVQFVPNLKYAYINGADEHVLESVARFGLAIHVISDDELGYLDLGQFDAIVVGPNAYLVCDQLRKHAARFLNYVEHGGSLIVQYQGYGYQHGRFAPYPFQYNQPHDRVTSEIAEVTMLEPDHFLFNQPNLIKAVDFEEWVHDRGLYFFGSWDKRYKPFLSCSDPGEEQKQGGLLITSFGRGTYIYASYSFFRQLPAGVPGAFRLFANLLAIPAAYILERARFLKNVTLFGFMDDEQLQAVGRIMSERWIDSGEYLCQQDDEGDEMYIIMQGSIEILKRSGQEKRMVFRATKGEAVGELQVLSRSPRAAAMRCCSDVHLLVIEGAHFRSLMHQYPDMSDRLIQMLVQRLAAAGV